VLTQCAFDVVEEDVGFESPALANPEPKLPYARSDLRQLARKAQLDFDFDFQSDTLKHRTAASQAKLS
jgi:hypothetical protein